MIAGWQMELLKRSMAGQLTKEQLAWIEARKAIPTEVIMSFVLSPEGAAMMQEAMGVISRHVDSMFVRVQEMSQTKPAESPAAPPVPAAPTQIGNALRHGR